MASLFFILSTYALVSVIRLPFNVQHMPAADLPKVIIASCGAGLCIGFPLGEAIRHLKHAGKLWQQAPTVAKVSAAVLYGLASAAFIGVPLLS